MVFIPGVKQAPIAIDENGVILLDAVDHKILVTCRCACLCFKDIGYAPLFYRVEFSGVKIWCPYDCELTEWNGAYILELDLGSSDANCCVYKFDEEIRCGELECGVLPGVTFSLRVIINMGICDSGPPGVSIVAAYAAIESDDEDCDVLLGPGPGTEFFDSVDTTGACNIDGSCANKLNCGHDEGEDMMGDGSVAWEPSSD